MGLFLVGLTAGAVAIAVWLDIRFDRFAPDDFGGALIHAGMALALGWLAVPAALAAVVAAGGGAVVALLAVAFPALTYMSLTALWVVKHAQGRLLRR